MNLHLKQAPPVPSTGEAERRRVLLADDDPVARMLMARLLGKAGYDVVAVGDGGAALQALRDGFFPVLLTDWEMPVLDGLGVLSAVRGGDWPGYIYTILMTGRDSRESVLVGLEAGADDYLVKPVDEAELLARMKTSWRIADLERRLRAAEQDALLLSLTDALTGLANRRYLLEELGSEVERARRFGRALSVILCDIDHFKKINDGHGHPAGDAVLQEFAAMLRSLLRGGVDWVARFGGEEFVVVLPETDLRGATMVAEKLRMATAALEVRHGADPIRLTASFGIAALESEWPERPVVEALLGQADLCLYRSKDAGRNCVTAERLRSAP